jgi:hypothetical protein
LVSKNSRPPLQSEFKSRLTVMEFLVRRARSIQSVPLSFPTYRGARVYPFGQSSGSPLVT